MAKEKARPPLLTELQEAIIDLLRSLGCGEDAVVGTILLTKDNVEEQEELLLYLYDNRPTPTEITNYLIQMVRQRNTK